MSQAAEDERLLDQIDRALQVMPNAPMIRTDGKGGNKLEIDFLTECARRQRVLEAFRRLRERAA